MKLLERKQKTEKGEATMLRKGLVALACLGVMSALWAWATAPAYELATRLVNSGGTIQVNSSLQSAAATTVYTNFTSATSVQTVKVAPLAGYRVSALLKNNVAVPYANMSTGYNTTFTGGTRTQSLVATFRQVANSNVAVAAWQLQIKNVNAGGTIVCGGLTQSGAGTNSKNFTSNAAITATVTPLAGYTATVKSSGTASAADPVTGAITVSGIPAAGAVVNYVNATYTLKGVTSTSTQATGGMITPATTTLAPGTTVKFTVAPQGPTYASVNSINYGSYAGTAPTLYSGYNPAFPANNVVTLPYAGVVYVVFPNVTAPITLTATYGKDVQNLASSCDKCHNAVPAIATLGADWAASGHKTAGIGCNECHTGMPGKVTKENVTPGTFKVMTSGVALQNGTVAAKGTSFCASCHATGAAIAKHVSGAAVNDCSVCHTFNAHSLADSSQKAVDFQSANNPHKARTGGHFTQGCAGCHTGTDVAVAPISSICLDCHNKPQYGMQGLNWQKSTHNEAINGFEDIGCSKCHNAHAPEIGVANVALLTDGKTDSCAQCHVYRDATHNYSIFTDATYATLKAPHGGGKMTKTGGAVADGDNITMYTAMGTVCSDCHGHYNSVNGGFADGGHGKVSSDPLNAFGHYDWSARTNNGTRQNGNCDRCHTAGGFVKFTQQDAALATRLAPVAGQPNNVLVCVSCHKTAEGDLRTDATPQGNGQALSAGYFALFSSASATAAGTQGQVAADKTKIQIAFPGYKNSSICVPCHSGRSTAAVFVAVIDQARAVNKNYSTVGTSYYQHAANMGQTFISKGGYDLTGQLATIAVSAHNVVKMGATDTQGPCVACHYSALTKGTPGTDGYIANATHSLEVNPDSPTCLAAACHTSAPDLVTTKANFTAALAALDTLIRVKFAPLQTVAGDLATERANVRFGQFGRTGTETPDQIATIAKNAYGAWYNWQILATYDNAAWAHNPRYARQLLNDTLCYLNANGVIPAGGYSEGDIRNAIIAGGGSLAAQTFVSIPGCNSCHTQQVTDYTSAANPHFGTAGRGMYYEPVACVNCHTENHDTAALAVNTSVPSSTLCITCHNNVVGQAHPSAQEANWTNSTHNTAHQVGFTHDAGCAKCHNAHAPELGVGNVALISDDKNDSCATCHTYSATRNSSIYTDATLTTLSAPHGGGVASYMGGLKNTDSSLYTGTGTNPATGYTSNGAVDNAAAGWPAATTSYMTRGAICSDCHGHDNTINGGFAEGGHGAVSSDPMNAFVHYDWSKQANNGTRQNGNCDRCHTAGGFMKFLGMHNTDSVYARYSTNLMNQQTYNTTQANYQANNVLVCVACHTNAEGPLRDGAAPSGNNVAGNGAGKTLRQGYFALFSTSVAAVGTGNTKTQVAFPGFDNSSICIPCHSGRTTDVYVRNNIAALGGTLPGATTLKNYSTLQLANYQHASNMAQTFIGKGGWDFSGKLKNYTSAANQSAHTTIGKGGQGPCVGCHYSTLTSATAHNATHSLEVNFTSTTCTPCHGAAGPQKVAAFAGFSSARGALDVLIRAKFAPLLASGSADLNVERGGYFRYGRFGKAAGVAADVTTAQNAYGAVYNWQLVKTWDANAWAHNPAYARQILTDTLAFVNSDGTVLTGTNATTAAAITAAAALVPANLDTAGVTAANGFVAGNKDQNALCTGCHAIARNAGSTYVQDNNGVRAITTEFGKWSHHVTGVALNDAHCAACHLEGKVVSGAVVVDPLKHMADNKIHLRNADDDTDMVWDPSITTNANHTVMDNFCMTCHDADGATSTVSQTIQAVITATNATKLAPVSGYVASALNPFGDTISNQYDQLSRGAVVAVKEQFDGGNSSHHGVRTARYNTRNLTVAQFSNISTANIANGTAGVSRNSQPANATVMATVGTLYETTKMSSYVPFGSSTVIGDDSRVHCADCHTVGQWKAGTTRVINADGSLGAVVATVIGAHGSENEYMLRNANGTDSNVATRGTTSVQPQLVCFICHAANQYDGATTNANAHNGAVSHSTNKTPVYSGTGCNSPTNNTQGVAATFAHSTSARLKLNTSKLVGGTYADATAGNILGNQCSNCHNSSDNKLFGGIHGNAARVGVTTEVTLNVGYKTYSSATGASPTDLKGLTKVDRKPYRFLPGLGNFRYNGGTSSDAWTRKAIGTAGKSDRMGCYTLNGNINGQTTKLTTPTAATGATPGVNTLGYVPEGDNGILGSWGGCSDHGGSTTSSTAGHGVTRTSIRPTTY
jgi:hypothetical protein